MAITIETKLETNPAELRRIDTILDKAIRKALGTMRGDITAGIKVAHMLTLFAATLAQECGLSLQDWREWCDYAEEIVTKKLDANRAQGVHHPLRNFWSVGPRNS